MVGDGKPVLCASGTTSFFFLMVTVPTVFLEASSLPLPGSAGMGRVGGNL